MCIYCEGAVTMPPTMRLKSDASDFFCEYCESDTSCLPTEDFAIGDVVMHEQDGLCVVVGIPHDNAYEIRPLEGQWSPNPTMRVNACEIQQA